MILDAGKGEKEKKLPDEELTGAIIGAATDVHRLLGPGFLESIYEKALCLELARVGLAFEEQKSVPVLYRGQVAGEHRLDLLVEGRIVVELKATKAIEPIHFAVARSYLKALDLSCALLFNFATAPLTVRRVDSAQLLNEVS